MGQVHFSEINFSASGVSGCSALSVKLGPLKIFSLEASQGRSDPCINLGPLISRFFFIDYFVCNYFYVFHSCIPSPGLLSGSWLKVKRRRKLCEGQPLCHSAVLCLMLKTHSRSHLTRNDIDNMNKAFVLDVFSITGEKHLRLPKSI